MQSFRTIPLLGFAFQLLAPNNPLKMIEEGYFEYGNFQFKNGNFKKQSGELKWGTKSKVETKS